MSVKIRLARRGRKKSPFYHIVVADARAPRDGRFIEKLGHYDPMTVPATIELDRDKAYDWLQNGAQPTDTARAILRFKGVMYKKHLMRGVSKGALTIEEADKLLNEWVDRKEDKITQRRVQKALEVAAYHKRISGTSAPVAKKVSTPIESLSSAIAADDDAGKTLAEMAAKESEPLIKIESEAKKEEPAVEVVAPVVEKVVEAAKPVVEAVAPVVEKVVEAAEPVVEAVAPVVEKVVEAAEPVVEAVAPVVEKVVEAAEPVVEAVAPVVEKVVEAAEPAVEAVAPVVEKVVESKPDDLKKIEGIGPKISEKLTEAGIATFSSLAEAQVEKLKEILVAAGSRYQMHDPTTWPEQAKLAADGKWDELKKWQDELIGGRPPEE